MKKIITLFALSTLLFFVACEDRSDLTAPTAPNTGDADFTRFVSIGNSLTAGYQSGSLYESSQVYSFGKIIADQVGTTYEQPLISEPGIPGKLELHDLTPTIIANSELGSLLNSTYAAPYNNLGVPGAILYDLIDETGFTAKSAARENPYFSIVLRDAAFGASIVKQALNLQPTFITLWIGNNDVLGYATSGGTTGTDPATGKLPTDVPTFTYLYNQVALALTDTTGHRKIAVANIPDVQNIPFFTTVGPKLSASLEAMGVPAMVYQSTHTGMGFGVATTADLKNGNVLLTLTGSGATAYLGDRSGAYYAMNNIAVPTGVVTDSAFGFSPYNPWPDKFTLEPAEITIAQAATTNLNKVISDVATANTKTWVLVDINSFFDDVADGGIMIDGINFTTSFILGNTFSLDGVHPTTRGYAIIANEFISAINGKFKSSISKVNVSSYPASISLNN
ncbi:MAG: hypothetical protein KKF62_12435 [Bacteroidetes bacterium]|nr:hypothetical protein [Bacteroidota bacterium]MBU1115087.1 hypothetical protein [Bacteroidota bacterium]MBU1799007.1 hypothetical protein [Bacteroidota bacterium]